METSLIQLESLTFLFSYTLLFIIRHKEGQYSFKIYRIYSVSERLTIQDILNHSAGSAA